MKWTQKEIKIVLLHIASMFFIFSALLVIVFQNLLPNITKPSALIVVPNLRGVHVDELEEALAKHQLRCKITDHVGYSGEVPPLTVLQQVPSVGTHVKENRKIYITLNGENPPIVKMPQLVDGSVRNAQLLLKNKGLLLGTIQYVPDIVPHAVLKQYYKGKPITQNTPIHQGASIDLEVGAGLKKELVTVPDLVGSSFEESKLLLLDIGIQIGTVHYEIAPDHPLGTILHQFPTAGSKLSIGNSLTISVAGVSCE